jgi:hypothetical protein
MIAGFIIAGQPTGNVVKLDDGNPPLVPAPLTTAV